MPEETARWMCCCGADSIACTCDDARNHFLDLLSISQLKVSNGINLGTIPEVSAWRNNCFGLAPPPTYPDLDYDASAVSVVPIRTDDCATELYAPVCSPDPRGEGWYLDAVCYPGSSFFAANYAWRGIGWSPNAECPTGYRSGTMQGSVQFYCDDAGELQYRLSVTSAYRLVIKLTTGTLTAPPEWNFPTSGVDWTLANPWGEDLLYTRNSGDATVAVYGGAASPGGERKYYGVVGTSVVYSPNTSVDLWVPDPLIDFTGITAAGRAELI